MRKMQRGHYIILEGISGVGKDTQALLLQKWLSTMGKESAIVREPSSLYYGVKTWFQKYNFDVDSDQSWFRKLLIFIDRLILIRTEVIPAMKQGKFVISVRSFISMLVYQYTSYGDRFLAMKQHFFVPKPDLIVVYDAPADICFQRIIERGLTTKYHDTLLSLERYYPEYQKFCDDFSIILPIKIIDATKSIEATHKQTTEEVLRRINY